MSKTSVRLLFGQTLAACAIALCTQACAPGADPASGAPPGPQGEEPEPVSVTVLTEKVELFMEYPRLVPGLEARFLAHLTVLATGEPVRSGRLELVLVRGSDSTHFEAPRPARDGLFIPVGALSAPGSHAASIVVQSDQVQEEIPLPPVVVHPDRASALAAAEAEAGEPADAVSFLLEQQWKVQMLLGRVERRPLTRRLQLPGVITARQNATAVASAPVAGRLLPPPSGRLPRVPDRVESGQVLGLVEPPMPATEMAALRANRAQLQTLEAELLQRGYELAAAVLEAERNLQQARARLDFARSALAREELLKEKGVGIEQQRDEAVRALQVAEAEHEAARALLDSHRAAATRMDELMGRSRATGLFPQAEAATLTLPLVAPISGLIARRELVEGEHVEALAQLCEIVDLERVWVVARLSEFDLDQLTETPSALLELPAFPGRRFDLRAMGGELVDVGLRVDPATRTVPIRFELPNPEGVFRDGMVADVLLTTRHVADGVAVPEEALVLDNGRPLVFVMLSGETFQRREIETGIRDGGWVEIVSGLAEGERVATRGAYAIKLAALSPASFGHGHGH